MLWLLIFFVMRQLITVILLMVWGSLSASAQYVDGFFAERSGNKIHLNGRELSREQTLDLVSDIGGIDYSDKWLKADGWRRAGLSMQIAGGGVSLAGLSIISVGMIGYMVESSAAIAEGLAKSDSHKYDKYQDGSIPGAFAWLFLTAMQPIVNTPQISPVWNLLAVIGAGLIDFGLLNVIAGTPIRIVNNVRMNRIVDKYNDWQENPNDNLASRNNLFGNVAVVDASVLQINILVWHFGISLGGKGHR